MATEKEKVEKIKQVFFEYSREDGLSAFDTSSYFARQIFPDESFFLKRKVIENLIESGNMVADNGKWILKTLGKRSYRNRHQAFMV